MFNSKLFSVIKERLGLIAIITFVLLLFAVLYIFFINSALDSLENFSYDLRCRIGQRFSKEVDDNKSVCLLYSNQCSNFISEHPEEELGKWPFPRAFMADVNDYLTRSNSQTVLFDVLFYGSTDDKNDNEFMDSLKASEIDYLGTTAFPLKSIIKVNTGIINNEKKLTLNKIDALIKAMRTHQNIKTSSSSKIKTFRKFSKTVNINSVPFEILKNTSSMDFNLPYYKFTEYAKGLGVVNVTSNNNIIRTAILIARFENNYVIPSLALAGVLDVLPKANSELSLKNNVLSVGDKEIYLNDQGEYFIDWNSSLSYKYTPIIKAYLYEKYYSLSPSKGFNILPEEENLFKNSGYSNFYRKSTSYTDENLLLLENYRIKYLNTIKVNSKQKIEKIDLLVRLGSYPNIFDSTSTILRKKLSNISKNIEKYGDFVIKPEMFTGKIVVVGDGEATSDIYSIPLNKVLPGPGIISNTVNNLLNANSFIRQSPLWLDLVIYLIFISLCICILKFSKNNIGSLFLFILLILIYLLICTSSFMLYKLWLPFVKPAFIFTLFFIFALITQNIFTKEQLSKTYKLATTDGLTGLFNHRYFQEKMIHKIQEVKRKEDSFSILLIDIDFFKKFNDTYGHRAGDAVLIQVGKTLNKSVRGNDIVCRYGGEEMCVILDKTVTEEAIKIANKLVRNIAANEFLIEDDTKIVNVTISIGVANYPAHGETVPQLVEFADQGLYRAKEGGRNRVGDLEDSLDNTAGKPVVSKELEIAKAKAMKEIEKIKEICQEKEINLDEVIDEILGKKEE